MARDEGGRRAVRTERGPWTILHHLLGRLVEPMRKVGIHLGSPHPNSSCWDTTRLAWLPGQSKGGRMMTTNERHRRRVLRHVQSAVAAAAIGFAASPAAATTCSQLASSFHRPNTTITTAQIVPAGTFVTPTVPPQSITGLPQFCRVAGFTT